MKLTLTVFVLVFLCTNAGEFAWIRPSNLISDCNVLNASSVDCLIYVATTCTTSSCPISEYHCPRSPNCKECDFRCSGETRTCQDATLYTYYCKNVNVYLPGSASYLHKGIYID